jgi:hypothetical protein
MNGRDPDRLGDLHRAMRLLADAVEQLPDECGDVSANALLNVAVEAVVEDVGCAQAGRIFSRLAELLHRGRQPSVINALSLTDFDA